MAEALSASAVLARMQSRFSESGYRVFRDVSSIKLPGDYSLLAEDDYSVVGVAGFDTWPQLRDQWGEAQSALVSLLSQRLSRSAPKAWDGYLILFTLATPTDQAEVVSIERDTTRLRKIVATGDLLQTLADVDRLLDPFLPLPGSSTNDVVFDILSELPAILSPEVDVEDSKVVIAAFRELEPLVERLHRSRNAL